MTEGAGDAAPARSSASSGFNYYLGTVGTHSAASGLQNIVYPWIIVSYLGLSANMLGIAQTVAMLPNLLLILLGGALSANRRLSRYLRNLYLLNILPFLAVAFIAHSGKLDIWYVLAYGCAFGVLTAFIQPARESLLPQVTDSDLQQAVAKISLVQFSAQSVGMLAAGFFDVIGLVPLLAIQCVLYFFASLCVDRTLPPQAAMVARPRQRESIRDGLVMVMHHPRLLPLMLIVFATGFLGIGAYVVAVPILAKEVYRLDAIFFAAMQLCFTLGVLLSNVLLMRMARAFVRPGRALLASLLLRGGLIMLISLEPPLWLAMPGLVIWGVFSGASMTLGRALTHEEADAEYNSRVVSIYQLCLFGAAPIGAFICGMITEYYDVATTLLVIGGATFFLSLLAIRFSGLWTMTRRSLAEDSAEQAPKGN